MSAASRSKISIHRMTAAAFAVVLPAVASPAFAQVWDGDGPSNPSWRLAANWAGNTLPVYGNTLDLSFPTSVVSGKLYQTTLGSVAAVARSLSFGADVDGLSTVTAFSITTTTGTAGQTLTMDTNGAFATINVDAGATGNIGIGSFNTGTTGAFTLADPLEINHNGTGNLTFNRAFAAAGFGITKKGQGRWVMAGIVSGELDSASGITLEAGTLEVQTTGTLTKNYAVPLNVTGASTLVYNNTGTNNLAFSLPAGALTLGANLTVQNTSVDAVQNNIINVSRNVSGSGDIIVSTSNNLASNAGNYSYQRVQLSGNNASWSGDFVIARGTGQLSGDISHGTGAVVIGTTANSFGAGLGFNQTSDVNFSRDITVRSGGFRGLKSNNLASGDITTADYTGYNMTFSGDITLEGTLAVDHSLINSSTFSPSPVITASHFVTISGDISGVGGLNVTRTHVPVTVNSPDSNRSRLVLTGTNTYTGATSVSSTAALIVDGSLTSNIAVNGGRFGGNGSTTGGLTMAVGSTFVFVPGVTFDVTGSVSLDNTFGLASLVNVDGTAIDWSLVGLGTYTLIGTTSSSFANIDNFGLGDAVEVVPGVTRAFFQDGSLQLVVQAVPEPATLGVIAAGAMLTLRRRKA